MNDVVTLWQEMLGETRQEDGWRAGLGSGIKALIVNLRTQFLVFILTHLGENFMLTSFCRRL